MPTPFKVEVFDRDIVYKSHTVINDTPFTDDYLTLKKTMLEIPKIDVDRGDYVHITDFSSNKKYQGIVDDVEKNKYTCMLTLKPLRSILDVSVTFDRTYLATGTLEGFISAIITAQFISNADTSQNITGLGVSTTSSTSGAVLDLDSNIGQLYNIITSALSAYGIVVDVELKPQDQEIDVTIGTASATVVKIEADLDNCIAKNFVIGDSYGAVNKLVLVNQDNEAQTATYYLHTDGTVSASDTDRVTPVICKYDYLPSKDFADKALARATQVLTPQGYDNLIELTYSMNDKIVNIANMAIGTVVSIDSEGKTYKSILTGFEKTEDVAKLIFGIVRIDQTDRQFIKSRSGSGSVYATAAQGAALEEQALSGWIKANEIWTYVSSTSFKVSGDAREKYEIGDKLIWEQNGGERKNNVIGVYYNSGVDETTISIHAGYISSVGDMLMLNTSSYPITNNYYSHQENPVGCQHWFKWSPSYSASGSMTFTGVSTGIARFYVQGRKVNYRIHATGSIGGTASTQIQFTVPINRGVIDTYENSGMGHTYEGTGGLHLVCAEWQGSSVNTLCLIKEASAVYTLGGSKEVRAQGFYEI